MIVILGFVVAVLCVCALYAVCHQVRHKLWDDMRQTWWFYCGTALAFVLFLSLI